MKKIISFIIVVFIIVSLTSCESELLTDVYYHDYYKLTDDLAHVEIVELPSNATDEVIVIRTFSYEESLTVIEDFCKIEYTSYYLAILTTPKWVHGTCLRVVRTNGEYSDYGITDGTIGSCTDKADFDAFISKYT